MRVVASTTRRVAGRGVLADDEADGADPGGAGGAQSSSTTYDPLDTNEDGTVSLAERLAGSSSAQEAAQALFSAIDTDGDQKLSSTEAQTFIDQLTAAATQAGTGTQQEQGTTLNLVQLAEQAKGSEDVKQMLDFIEHADRPLLR